MKKELVIFAMSAAVSISAAAQVRPFVQAGIGASEFWLMNAEGTEGRFASHVGVGVEIPVKNRLGILPSLLLVSKGANAPASKNDDIETNINLVYLEMPLDVTYRFAMGSKWNLKIAAESWGFLRQNQE